MMTMTRIVLMVMTLKMTMMMTMLKILILIFTLRKIRRWVEVTRSPTSRLTTDPGGEARAKR